MMLTRFLALAFLVIGLSACDSGGETGDGGPDIDARIVSDLPADPTVGVDSLGRPVGTGEATFFDLSENAIVATADSASADRDIALRATTSLENSGASGPGTASAQVVEGVFEDLLEAPVDGYTQDSAGGFAIPTGSGNGWYNYNFGLNLITPVPGRILVVRTSDGLYAKIRILNYYLGAPETIDPAVDESRYYTFEYVIQYDGSRNFTE